MYKLETDIETFLDSLKWGFYWVAQDVYVLLCLLKVLSIPGLFFHGFKQKTASPSCPVLTAHLHFYRAHGIAGLLADRLCLSYDTDISLCTCEWMDGILLPVDKTANIYGSLIN